MAPSSISSHTSTSVDIFSFDLVFECWQQPQKQLETIPLKIDMESSMAIKEFKIKLFPRFLNKNHLMSVPIEYKFKGKEALACISIERQRLEYMKEKGAKGIGRSEPNFTSGSDFERCIVVFGGVDSNSSNNSSSSNSNSESAHIKRIILTVCTMETKQYSKKHQSIPELSSSSSNKSNNSNTTQISSTPSLSSSSPQPSPKTEINTNSVSGGGSTNNNNNNNSVGLNTRSTRSYEQDGVLMSTSNSSKSMTKNKKQKKKKGRGNNGSNNGKGHYVENNMNSSSSSSMSQQQQPPPRCSSRASSTRTSTPTPSITSPEPETKSGNITNDRISAAGQVNPNVSVNSDLKNKNLPIITDVTHPKYKMSSKQKDGCFSMINDNNAQKFSVITNSKGKSKLQINTTNDTNIIGSTNQENNNMTQQQQQQQQQQNRGEVLSSKSSGSGSGSGSLVEGIIENMIGNGGGGEVMATTIAEVGSEGSGRIEEEEEEEEEEEGVGVGGVGGVVGEKEKGEGNEVEVNTVGNAIIYEKPSSEESSSRTEEELEKKEKLVISVESESKKDIEEDIKDIEVSNMKKLEESENVKATNTEKEKKKKKKKSKEKETNIDINHMIEDNNINTITTTTSSKTKKEDTSNNSNIKRYYTTASNNHQTNTVDTYSETSTPLFNQNSGSGINSSGVVVPFMQRDHLTKCINDFDEDDVYIRRNRSVVSLSGSGSSPKFDSNSNGFTTSNTSAALVTSSTSSTTTNSSNINTTSTMMTIATTPTAAMTMTANVQNMIGSQEKDKQQQQQQLLLQAQAQEKCDWRHVNGFASPTQSSIRLNFQYANGLLQANGHGLKTNSANVVNSEDNNKLTNNSSNSVNQQQQQGHQQQMTRLDIHTSATVSHPIQDTRSISTRNFNNSNSANNNSIMHSTALPISYPINIVSQNLMQQNILPPVFVQQILPPNTNTNNNVTTQALPIQQHKAQQPTHYQKIPPNTGAYPINSLLQKFHHQSNPSMHHKNVVQQDTAILNAVPMVQATLAQPPPTLPLPNAALAANPVIYANGQVMQVAPVQMAMHPVQAQDVSSQPRAPLPHQQQQQLQPLPSHSHSQQPVVMEDETVKPTPEELATIENVNNGNANDLDRLLVQMTPLINLDPRYSVKDAIDNLRLEDIWNFYYEPSMFGQEVYLLGGVSIHTKGPSVAYFLPSLSGIQLFIPTESPYNASTDNLYICDIEYWPKYMRLHFETFEANPPWYRLPMYDTMQSLSNDFPDIKNLYLRDLHPASWFCVAWYPLYRIPDAPLVTRFLTFHSFHPPLHKASQTLRGGTIPLPVYGLEWYNMKDEQWLDNISLTKSPRSENSDISASVSSIKATERNINNLTTVLSSNNANQMKCNGHVPMSPRNMTGTKKNEKITGVNMNGINNGNNNSSGHMNHNNDEHEAWERHVKELRINAKKFARGMGLRKFGRGGIEEAGTHHHDFEFFYQRN